MESGVLDEGDIQKVQFRTGLGNTALDLSSEPFKRFVVKELTHTNDSI